MFTQSLKYSSKILRNYDEHLGLLSDINEDIETALI